MPPLPIWTASSSSVRRAQIAPEPVHALSASPRMSEVSQEWTWSGRASTSNPPRLSEALRRASVRQRLDEAHQAGRLFRRRVHLPIVALGLLLMLSGVPLALGLSFISELTSLPPDIVSSIAACFLIVPGLILLLLSLLPADTRSVYFSGLVAMAAYFTFAGLHALRAWQEARLLGSVSGLTCLSPSLGAVICWFSRCIVSYRCIISATCAGAGVRLLCVWLFGKPHARSRINFLWKNTGQSLGAVVTTNVCFLVVAAASETIERAFAAESPARAIWVTWIVCDVWYGVVLLLLYKPSFRTTVQSYFTKRAEVMMAAAGVASLLEVHA